MKPTHRFTNRAEDYRRHRPDYPDALLTFLASQIPPDAEATVADLGSGTGIFTRQLLDAGYRVIACEPNEAMRQAAIDDLGDHPRFEQRDGTAETTGLPDHSIDLITAAQAFHWFAPEACRREFQRILKPGGAVALIWNERAKTGSAFAEEYEDLLQRHGTDYTRVDHTRTAAEKMRVLFASVDMLHRTFPHAQHLDRKGLHGRVASSSYTPAEGEPGHAKLHDEIDALFDRHQRSGLITIEYTTHIHLARM